MVRNFSIFFLLFNLFLLSCVMILKENDNQFDWIGNYQKSKLQHGLAKMDIKATMQPHEQLIAMGKDLFTTHCVACHGPFGKGDGLRSVELKTKPANLQFLAKRFPDHYFYVQIRQGKEEMPSWKNHFNDDQLRAITLYIRALSTE